MNPVRVSAKPFNGYFPGSRREYLGFIRLVLKYADTVCFTVCPYLDNPGELGSSIWSCLSDSVLDYGLHRPFPIRRMSGTVWFFFARIIVFVSFCKAGRGFLTLRKKTLFSEYGWKTRLF